MLDELITESYDKMKLKTENRKVWRSSLPWTCRRHYTEEIEIERDIYIFTRKCGKCLKNNH